MAVGTSLNAEAKREDVASSHHRQGGICFLQCSGVHCSLYWCLQHRQQFFTSLLTKFAFCTFSSSTPPQKIVFTYWCTFLCIKIPGLHENSLICFSLLHSFMLRAKCTFFFIWKSRHVYNCCIIIWHFISCLFLFKKKKFKHPLLYVCSHTWD